VDDAYTTDEDTSLNVPAPGVLANDSDPDGDALTAVLVGGPANGTLALNANGGFSYTPGLNFNGVDSFTYVANDGQVDSNIATVTITVNAVNDAPVATNDAYSTDEDTPLNVAAPGVLGNDTDADVDALTAVLNTGPGNGTLTLNADGSFSYTPNANFNGSDSFTYVANDGTVDSNIATVAITVNAAAVIDLDVAQFKVTKRVRLANIKPIAISLVVKNDGVVNTQERPATVIGTQGGVEVYTETLLVHDEIGNGRTQFDFPAFTPSVAGDISWTVTIADDDPDVDEATAVTTVQ
jgi:hypothetical protein